MSNIFIRYLLSFVDLFVVVNWRAWPRKGRRICARQNDCLGGQASPRALISRILIPGDVWAHEDARPPFLVRSSTRARPDSRALTWVTWRSKAASSSRRSED